MSVEGKSSTPGRPPAVRSRRGAAVALAAYVLGTLLCVGVSLTDGPAPPSDPPPGATTDLDVYRRIVARVHAGEPYHDAARRALRAHDYPTRSVFNWRTPVYAWWLASPAGWYAGAACLALGVALTAVAFARDLIDENGLLPAALGMTFYVGATAWCFGGETHLFTEVWAGVLIAGSVCAYNRGRGTVGVVAGLAALFYRELALPYCLVCLWLAVRARRKSEAAAWVAGLGAFLVFMAWHAGQVNARLTPADVAFPGGWLRFGGLRFVLSTVRTNVVLMPLPDWCTALYLPFCLVGFLNPRGERGARVGLTVVAYLAAFAVVGNPFNFYWGFLVAPLLATGAASAPPVLRGLLTRASADRAVRSRRLADA